MAARCPEINWLSFFKDMDKRQQREFELSLCQRDLTLGEFMEIVEQSTMEPYGRTKLCSGPIWDREILSATSQMLSVYVSKKSLLLLATSHERELQRLAELVACPDREDVTEASPKRRYVSGRVRLRAAIHKRIEKIKRGVEKP